MVPRTTLDQNDNNKQKVYGLKLFDQFYLVGKVEGTHTHHVFELKKQPKNENPLRTNSIWCGKLVDNPYVAFREVIVQEALRLVLEGQTKTRIVNLNSEHLPTEIQALTKYNKGMIVSKKIENTQTLKVALKKHKKLSRSPFKHLGVLSTFGVWVNYTDFHLENILVGNSNTLYGIDGDRALQGLPSTQKYDKDKQDNKTITKEVIKALPNKPGYPYTLGKYGSWLDYKPKKYALFFNDEKDYESQKFSTDICEDENIILEKNQTILKILLLNDDILTKFVHSYGGNLVATRLKDEIKNELIERRDQLNESALNIDSFIEYLKSPQAQSDVTVYVKYLKQFKTTEHHFLLSDIENIEDKIIDTFYVLREQCTSISNKK